MQNVGKERGDLTRTNAMLHFGKQLTGLDWHSKWLSMESVVEQRDPGEQGPCSLKVATLIDRVVKKAFVALAFSSQGITYKN